MKQLLFFLLVFLSGKNIDAQRISSVPTFTIDTLFTAMNIKEDVINITVSNPGETSRQLIMEIVAVEEENSYWGTIYSAAINEDSYFFKQWREGKKLAEKMNVKFALPRYNKLYQSIDADEAKDFSFTISGKPMQKGTAVRLRITATDNNEMVYSSVFYLYKQPN
ncbi:MAG: hypothetical protein IT249_02035 [Chitinophagaceae bacterium]|nr:hypothetical protein [Chitinophagaceae bacterium]